MNFFIIRQEQCRHYFPLLNITQKLFRFKLVRLLFFIPSVLKQFLFTLEIDQIRNQNKICLVNFKMLFLGTNMLFLGTNMQFLVTKMNFQVLPIILVWSFSNPFRFAALICY